jgi:hypothetical protein
MRTPKLLRSRGWKPAPRRGEEFWIHAWRPSVDKESGFAHSVRGAESLEVARAVALDLFDAGWVGVEIRQNDG